MPTVRISTREVRVDDTIYSFDGVEKADAFEACAATVDAGHCEADYPPLEKRTVTDDGSTDDQ